MRISIHQDSTLAAIMYAILATAGLFYVNLGGAFLSAFVDGLGVGRDEAGLIVSANKYGAAAGALIATFLVKSIPWRKTAAILLILMKLKVRLNGNLHLEEVRLEVQISKITHSE